jgi:hypothetical protein
MVPFFLKLKTAFACWGWMYIIGLFAAVLFLLAYSGLILWMLSTSQQVPYPFCTPP